MSSSSSPLLWRLSSSSSSSSLSSSSSSSSPSPSPAPAQSPSPSSIDDYKLEQTLCTICHKYLSVFPIKIYGDNQIITCGRCSEKNDEGERSLYEIVAAEFLFKCINRYEGCKELLKPEDVKNHEQKCIGSYFVCPKCKDGIAKSVLELIWHFKTQHSENFLKKKSFGFNLSKNKDTFLYINDIFNVIFIICYQYQAESKTLNISAISLTTNVSAYQQFEITAGTVQIFTEEKMCKALKNFKDFCYKINLNEVSVDLVTVFFELDPSISADFIDYSKVMVVTRDTKFLTQDRQVINSVCYNCNELIGNDIYRCVLKLHPVCKDCNIWCGFCQCTVTNQKVLISNLEKTLLFPCNYCEKTFPDIKNHQMNCGNNIKTCPICFMNIKVTLLESHFKLHETVSFLFQFSLDKNNFLNFKNEIYFFLNEKFILFKWERNSDSSFYDFNVEIQDDIDNAKLLLIFNNKVIKNHPVTKIHVNWTKRFKLCLQFSK